MGLYNGKMFSGSWLSLPGYSRRGARTNVIIVFLFVFVCFVFFQFEVITERGVALFQKHAISEMVYATKVAIAKT